MPLMTTHIGSQLVDLGSALLLLTCFAIVAQRTSYAACCGRSSRFDRCFSLSLQRLITFLTGKSITSISAAALPVGIKANDNH